MSSARTALPPAAVIIDGRKPSAFPELYGFTPALTTPPGKWQVKWPVIAPIRPEKPLFVRDWTMELTKPPGSDEKLFTFTRGGSITGPDGEGSSDARFVSKSGRIAFTPEDWDAHYALTLAGMKPFPVKFTARWIVVPRFIDNLVTPGFKGSGKETVITLAQGLTDTKHTLEIFVSAETPIAALRVYRPALAAKTN